MVTIRDKNRNVVRSSKNLRGLLEHARRQFISNIFLLSSKAGAGRLDVFFGNGDYCMAEFASFSVMTDWLKRRRSWQHEALHLYYNASEITWKDLLA